MTRAGAPLVPVEAQANDPQRLSRRISMFCGILVHQDRDVKNVLLTGSYGGLSNPVMPVL